MRARRRLGGQRRDAHQGCWADYCGTGRGLCQCRFRIQGKNFFAESRIYCQRKEFHCPPRPQQLHALCADAHALSRRGGVGVVRFAASNTHCTGPMHRVASIPTLTATRICASWRRPREARRMCTCTPSPRWKCCMAPRPATPPCRSTWPACGTPGSARWCVLSPHASRDCPRLRGDETAARAKAEARRGF
jgi:hypothetical protein